MLFAVLLTLMAAWNPVTARYAIILKSIMHCANDSKLVVHYNYSNVTNKGTGYFEYLEKIDTNVQMAMTAQYKNMAVNQWLGNHAFNISKTEVCPFIHTDMLILPYLRQFVQLEQFCPINPGKYPIRKSIIYIKYQPLIPMGCWKSVFRFEKSGRKFACVQLTIHVLQTLESPVPHITCD